MANVQLLAAKIDPRDALEALDDISKGFKKLSATIKGQGAQVQKSTAQTSKRVTGSLDRMRNSASHLRSALGFLGGALAVREIFQYAESWIRVENALRAVVKSGETLLQVQNRVFAIAQESRIGAVQLAESYQQMAIATRDMNVSGERLGGILNNISKLAQVGGSSTQAMNAGIIQLNQALASGRLAGDEFRSVMENIPIVAIAIADSLGVAVGELRRMSEAGELTKEVLIPALEDMEEAAELLFSTIQVSASKAFTVFNNSVTKLVGTIDKMTNTSKNVASGLIDSSNAVDKMSAALEKNIVTADKYIVSVENMSKEELEASLQRSMATLKYLQDTRDLITAQSAARKSSDSLWGSVKKFIGAADVQDYAMAGALKKIAIAAEAAGLNILQATNALKQLNADEDKAAEQTEAHARVVNAYLDSLERQVSKLTDVEGKVKEVVTAELKWQQLQQKGISVTAAQTTEYEALIESLKALTAARDEKEVIQFQRSLQEELDVLSGLTPELKKTARAREEYNELVESGIKLSKEDVKNIEKTIDAMAELELAQLQLKESLEALKELGSVLGLVADMFSNMNTNFGDMAATMVSGAQSMLAAFTSIKGIMGSKEFSALTSGQQLGVAGGVLGAGATGATMGSQLGGRTGGILGGALAGGAAGAMTGNPIIAVAGAIVGAVMGALSGDNKEPRTQLATAGPGGVVISGDVNNANALNAMFGSFFTSLENSLPAAVFGAAQASLGGFDYTREASRFSLEGLVNRIQPRILSSITGGQVQQDRIAAEVGPASGEQLLNRTLALAEIFGTIEEGLTIFSDVTTFEGTVTAFLEMRQEGESFAQTMNRVRAAVAFTSEAFEIFALDSDTTTTAFAEFSTAFVDALGGMDAALSQTTAFVARFYTQQEQLDLALGRATDTASEALDEIGLSLADFGGESGIEDFRAAFDLIKDSLSPEQMASWIEAGNALGFFVDATEAAGAAALAAAAAEEARLDSIEAILALSGQGAARSGMSQFEQQVFAIELALAATIAQLIALEASEADLAQVRADAATQIAELQRAANEAAEAEAERVRLQEQAAMQAEKDEIEARRLALEEFNRDVAEQILLMGMTEFEQQIREIRQETEELVSEMLLVGATEEDIKQARYLGLLQELALVNEIGDSIQQSIEDTKESIRLALINTPEETEAEYNRLKAEAERLRALLPTLTDPGEVERTVNAINEITRQAFGLLDEDQRERVGQEMIDFLDSVAMLARDQIDSISASLIATDTASPAEVAGTMEQASNTFSGSVDEFGAFVASLRLATSDLSNITITVNSDNASVINDG